jgi:hypothetical protein
VASGLGVHGWDLAKDSPAGGSGSCGAMAKDGPAGGSGSCGTTAKDSPASELGLASSMPMSISSGSSINSGYSE